MSTPPRRLPRSNAPQPRQSLAGYVLNLSYRLDIPPSALMKRTGLTTKSRTHILRLDYGMQLPPECLKPFAHATGMQEDEAAGLTMESLATLTGLPGISKVRNDRHWIDIRTTRYCPECLATTSSDEEHPVWRLDWLTPWAIACVRHSRVLLTCCPTCDTRVGETSGQLRSLIPHVMVPVTHPAACRAKPASAKHLPLCDTRLDQVEAPAANERLLRIQRTLDHALSRESPVGLTSLGTPVTGRQYLLDIRLMMVLLQIANDQTVLDGRAEQFNNAAKRYLATRAENVGALRRQGRTVTLPPDDFHASIGLLIAAEDLLSTPTSEQQINHLATQALAREVNTWRAAQAGGEPSTALWAALTNRRGHTTAPGKLHLHTGGTSFTLKPENIPAYLPMELYRKHFPDVAPEYARRIRRHVPITITRFIGGFPTARDAGVYLGYADQTTQDAARSGAAFPKEGLSELHARVAAITHELEAAPRVDYNRPRTKIRLDWTLPDDDWADLRHRLRDARLVRSDVNWDKRRILYSVWLWTLLTGGDMRLAPMSVPERRKPSGMLVGTVKQVRDLQRNACPRHHAIIENLAENLRLDF